MFDDDQLMSHWTQRQAHLRTWLDALGGTGLDYRADLTCGRFWWQRADGRPVVVASTRFLGSFARSNDSFLSGWANTSIPPDAIVPPVDGIPDRVVDCTEADAWTIALRIAETVGAHFVYRATTPQHFTFLALWDVRAAAEGEAPFVDGSPWLHVRQVLANIKTRLDGGGSADALARGFGRTFAQDHMRRGTSLEAPLRSVGERLGRLAGASEAEQRAVIATLDAEVALHEAN